MTKDACYSSSIQKIEKKTLGKPMIEHLSIQSKLDPRRAMLVLVSKKTWTSLIGDRSKTPIFFKNGVELRKLQPPKIEGVKNSKRKTTKHYKDRFLNTQKNSFYVCFVVIKVPRWFVKL